MSSAVVAETSLPDPHVMGKLCEYLSYVHQQFPWIKPLEKARQGDFAWEIAGYHASGICVAVRCYLDHKCPVDRAFNESLNDFVVRHLKETGGACLKGHYWAVVMRPTITDFAGMEPPNSKVRLRTLTTPEADLAPICACVRSLTTTLVERDDDLDMTGDIQPTRCAPTQALMSAFVDKDGDMQMDTGDVPMDEDKGEATIPFNQWLQQHVQESQSAVGMDMDCS